MYLIAPIRDLAALQHAGRFISDRQINQKANLSEIQDLLL